MDNVFHEYFSGRCRPRHLRFSNAIKNICLNHNYPIIQHHATVVQRIKMYSREALTGVRSIKKTPYKHPLLIHQACISNPSLPYICEFDLPLALHNYKLSSFRKNYHLAQQCLENEHLKTIIVFSEWAKRSFFLHFGTKVAEKCKVVYPLATTPLGNTKSYDNRKYDFIFISNDFFIKSGPQLVEAFCRLQKNYPEATLCIVTDLKQARERLGELNQNNITWKQTNLNEKDIGNLLNNSRCLLHPSLIDSFGVVVVEALAAGCALITTDIASFPEMNMNNKNGFLFSPPWAAVVGDDFITEFGNTKYARSYLSTLKLSSISDQLEVLMSRILSDPQKCRDFMHASKTLYDRSFSLSAWQAAMKPILHKAFGMSFS